MGKLKLDVGSLQVETFASVEAKSPAQQAFADSEDTKCVSACTFSTCGRLLCLC